MLDPYPMKKFLLLIILFSGLYFSARILLVWDKPNSTSSARVATQIPKGSSLKSISQTLHDLQLIRDPLAFQLFIKWNKLNTKLQAGEYIIQRNLTFSEIAEILQHGKSSEIKVTIPEGSTIQQIDTILTRKSLIKKGEFANCTSFCELNFSIANLEGFLFPSTYFINPKTFSTKSFTQRLHQEFLKKIKPFQNDITNSKRKLNEIVIVASMIEREASNDFEMPEIADVIWKRLDNNIHLGIDATTRYEKNDWKNPLYAEDFTKDSPYNTRKRTGLPPTAISNPGLAAIRAAANPTPNSHWYYLHDRTGQIHFAETLEGHNKNKRIYLN